MVNPALNGQIEALVDSLRNNPETQFSLTEVAGVTEVLIKTMQLYFRSVDIQVYEECLNLTDYISNARREIAALQPENLELARIPRAGKELDAIVRHTEEATNTIMDASEKIMAADDESDDAAYRSAVNEQIMRIFEACSFQDITGQRISKVVETLTYIEDRASQIRSILGVTDDDTATASPMDPSDNDDSQLLSGPALDGEGIDQNAIDALLQDDAAPKPLKDTKAAAAPARTGRKAKPRPVKSTPEKDEADADPKGSNTQDEIDALFG